MRHGLLFNLWVAHSAFFLLAFICLFLPRAAANL